MNIKFTFLLVLFAYLGLQAQNIDSIAQNSAIDVSNTLFAKRTFTNHFFGANHSLLDFEDYRGGFELNYARNLVNNIDISFPFRVNVIRLPEETQNRNNFSLDGLMHLHYDKSATVDPYLLAGAGAVLEPSSGSSTDVQIPLGVGVNIKMNKVLFLNLQTEYRFSLSGERHNYIHGIGLGINLNELIKPVIPEEKQADRDGDGIPDTSDDCPDIKGKLAFGGCPDSDDDGIGDQEDACPDLAAVSYTHLTLPTTPYV